MKKSKLSKLLSAGLGGFALAGNLYADVTLVVTGGNASKNVLYDRAAAILSGATVTNLAGNANVRSYLNGTIAGLSGLGNVTIHFVLNGAVQGLQDLENQANTTNAQRSLVVPTLAVSSTAPETVGLDSSPFTTRRTLVNGFVFTRNPARSPNLASVTNLTQRQAAYLEGAAGFLPSAFFGGTSTNDTVYFVGRNTGAAVRAIIDANIYFTGTLSTWTTNAAGQPIADATGGQIGGSQVNAVLSVLTNAIGTVAAQDISTNIPLAYEGVPFSKANVANGSYPIWSYENWYYFTSGTAAPSANQLAVINALFNAVTDYTYQHTAGNVFDTGKYVPLGDLQVDRSSDGGPIFSIIY